MTHERRGNPKDMQPEADQEKKKLLPYFFILIRIKMMRFVVVRTLRMTFFQYGNLITTGNRALITRPLFVRVKAVYDTFAFPVRRRLRS